MGDVMKLSRSGLEGMHPVWDQRLVGIAVPVASNVHVLVGMTNEPRVKKLARETKEMPDAAVKFCCQRRDEVKVQKSPTTLMHLSAMVAEKRA